MKLRRLLALTVAVPAALAIAAVPAIATDSGSSSAAATATGTVKVSPLYGPADSTGKATARASVPCGPEATAFRFVVRSPDAIDRVFGGSFLGTPLAADHVADSSVVGPRALFPIGSETQEGVAHKLVTQCYTTVDDVLTITEPASVDVKINNGVWSTLSPEVRALPTKIGALRFGLVLFRGFAPGEHVDGAVRAADGTSTPVSLQPQIAPDGTWGGALLTLPATVADGSYTLVLSGTNSKATSSVAITLDSSRLWW
ncbi:hypothetical protein [Embleya scabrispora]|uniref:hypothetical protein n=1 Tax=Embleya scabrispora TaxID=159449 RepID=UPI00036A116D|nr:hypothetical protein [Embleya scabrispora]MYS85910.1 hypothetical protein [Streptomyces sp. SID5474]